MTLEALVSILQDPDNGVPRPSLTVLDNVRIKKGGCEEVYVVDIL